MSTRRRKPLTSLATLDALIDLLNFAGKTDVPVHVTTNQAAEIRRLKHLGDGPLTYRNHPITEANNTTTTTTHMNPTTV